MSGAITIRDLFVVYRTAHGDAPALQGVSLDVREGEIVAVIGASGSGKTTLLRAIAGVEEPAAGAVTVLGERMDRLPESTRARIRATRLGVVSQYAAETLPPDLSTRDAVALQARLLGTPRGEALAEAGALLDDVGLGALAGARTIDLSGGERQRAAVCAALAHRPALVLADEPTGELDAVSARQVNELFGRLVRARGATAFIVSHDAGVAAIADRSLSIADGRLASEEVDGRASVVVGAGGWVRLPDGAVRAAGMGSRATLDATDDGIHLRRLGPPAAPTAPRPRLGGSGGGNGATGVRFEAVVKSFGQRSARRVVLPGLSGRALAGELTVVAGRSGSGKTTLLRLLAGLDRPDSGAIVVVDQPLDPLDEAGRADLRRRLVALVAQDVGLVPFLSASENVALGLQVRGIEDVVERTAEAIAVVGLGHRAGQRTEVLSAGERQRAAIARALAPRPRVMLLDEPTSRLDGENADAIAGLLLEIARNTGAAVICATHDERIVSRGDHLIPLGDVRES